MNTKNMHAWKGAFVQGTQAHIQAECIKVIKGAATVLCTTLQQLKHRAHNHHAKHLKLVILTLVLIPAPTFAVFHLQHLHLTGLTLSHGSFSKYTCVTSFLATGLPSSAPAELAALHDGSHITASIEDVYVHIPICIFMLSRKCSSLSSSHVEQSTTWLLETTHNTFEDYVQKMLQKCKLVQQLAQ